MSSEHDSVDGGVQLDEPEFTLDDNGELAENAPVQRPINATNDGLQPGLFQYVAPIRSRDLDAADYYTQNDVLIREDDMTEADSDWETVSDKENEAPQTASDNNARPTQIREPLAELHDEGSGLGNETEEPVTTSSEQHTPSDETKHGQRCLCAELLTFVLGFKERHAGAIAENNELCALLDELEATAKKGATEAMVASPGEQPPISSKSEGKELGDVHNAPGISDIPTRATVVSFRKDFVPDEIPNAADEWVATPNNVDLEANSPSMKPSLAAATSAGSSRGETLIDPAQDQKAISSRRERPDRKTAATDKTRRRSPDDRVHTRRPDSNRRQAHRRAGVAPHPATEGYHGAESREPSTEGIGIGEGSSKAGGQNGKRKRRVLDDDAADDETEENTMKKKKRKAVTSSTSKASGQDIKRKRRQSDDDAADDEAEETEVNMTRKKRKAAAAPRKPGSRRSSRISARK